MHSQRKSKGNQRRVLICYFLSAALCCLLLSSYSRAQRPTPSTSTGPTPQQPDDVDAYVPGDWAPALLDGILSSPSPDAREALLDATFAAGPLIVPQLEAALKDDRTAEFAAQSLALIGGDKALGILTKLVDDRRDLDLRRFFYGALAEFGTPNATQVLLDALAGANAEPDRTVTEAAILAFTVRSDRSLIAPLREIQSKIKDVVIRDDLDNALDVIEARARYLASPAGKKGGVSVDRAVRTYFIPALEQPVIPAEPIKPTLKNSKPVKSTTSRLPQTKPLASAEIQRLTFSPDKSRTLAHVVFETPDAAADYDMVLQKQYGDWTIASVWLGAETEKPQPTPRSKPAPEN